MSVEIIQLNSAAGYDLIQIKLEKVYKEAYSERYRRLGYRETECLTEKADGKTYAVVTLQRDKSQPEYAKLCEIERQIGELLGSERPVKEVDGDKHDKRRLALSILFWAGIALIAAGVVMLICGVLSNILGLALGGWGFVIAGAAALFVWSFLRESWRMRKIDRTEDAAYPGFGNDDISRQIEEKLRAADKLRAGITE